MSNRRRKYQSIGGGLSYDGKWRKEVCDGTRHFITYTKPKRSYRAGKCNCAEFMDAMMQLFGVKDCEAATSAEG